MSIFSKNCACFINETEIERKKDLEADVEQKEVKLLLFKAFSAFRVLKFLNDSPFISKEELRKALDLMESDSLRRRFKKYTYSENVDFNNVKNMIELKHVELFAECMNRLNHTQINEFNLPQYERLLAAFENITAD